MKEACPEDHFVRDAREALQHARASVVASGTATVQAAVIATPLSSSTASPAHLLAGKPWFAILPRYGIPPGRPDGNLPIAMVNLVAGDRIVPELLQDRSRGNAAAVLRAAAD